MNELKNILKSVLKERVPGYSEREIELAIFSDWKEIVGETLAKHAWPVKFVDTNTLLIASESSAHVQNLKYQEREILDRFEAFFKVRRVQKLVFKIESRSKL